jgi:hypothetical protein
MSQKHTNETFLVYTLLSSVTHINPKTASSKNVHISENIHKFLWKILNVCTVLFSKNAILDGLNTLSGLEISSPVSPNLIPPQKLKLNFDIKDKITSNLLDCLLSQASDNWHVNAESRHTTLVLLSFCLSLVQSKDGLNPLMKPTDNTDKPGNTDNDLHDMIKEKEENIQIKKKIHSTGELMIISAISSLDIKQKKSLNLAIEFFSLQLDKKECRMLKNIF